MKHCKQYLFFLFAGALLLLPVTSYYAISWKEIKKRASKLVDTETLQKNIPGALIVLGLAGGLYYWWKSRGVTEPIRFEIAGQQVTQFPVYSQFWSNVGGNASCGYHTLLRGMQIVEAKAHNKSDDDLQKTLKSSNFIAKYFGENGSWRQAIIQRRQNNKRHGDWLQADELEYLWNEQEKLGEQGQGIISKDVYCDFTAIDDFSRIDPYGVYSFESLKELKEGEMGLDKMIWGIQQKLQLMANLKKSPIFIYLELGIIIIK